MLREPLCKILAFYSTNGVGLGLVNILFFYFRRGNVFTHTFRTRVGVGLQAKVIQYLQKLTAPGCSESCQAAEGSAIWRGSVTRDDKRMRFLRQVMWRIWWTFVFGWVWVFVCIRYMYLCIYKNGTHVKRLIFIVWHVSQIILCIY